ncbi:hypothetical protein PybrP1_010282, partial [[Pythium] brassicae (nom. inval.)]
MPLRTSWQPKEEPAGGTATAEQSHTSRLKLERSAKARGVEATARLLRPTHSSLARVTTKRLSGEEKAKAEARRLERKRRQMARVTKQNGRLTVPLSPKLRTRTRAKPSATLLTMTSRELLEIAAIKKRVQETRKKVQKYHEATTRSVLSTASSVSSSGSSSSSKSSFSAALRSCGGLGVPAVRRAKLTQPIGFEFEIDKRLESRKRASTAGGSTSSTGGPNSNSNSNNGGGSGSASSVAKDFKAAEPQAKR